MKRAIRKVLGIVGLLLMIASIVWISFHQEKRTAGYKESKATQPQTSKPFAVVVLDPGHGGQDSGAMCGGIMEKDLTLDIARRVDRLLDSEGVATLMTRVGDSYVSLADRAAFGSARVVEDLTDRRGDNGPFEPALQARQIFLAQDAIARGLGHRDAANAEHGEHGVGL